MAEYTSKKQVEKALKKAREAYGKAKDAERAEKDPIKKAELAIASAEALKVCQNTLFVLDRWDALHS